MKMGFCRDFATIRAFLKTPVKPVVAAPSPPTADWLLAHRQHGPAQTKGVNPLASLYRMYEYIVLGYYAGLRTEIEWFFNHASWDVASIPDPKDLDATRYAILSGIPQLLVEVFNRLIERGLPRGSPGIISSEEEEEELKARPIVLETVPAWVANVPKLKEAFVIPNDDGTLPNEHAWSPQFLSKNIIVERHYTFFV